MTEYKTMRVPEDAWEQAQAYRKEHGLTWGEYIRLPCDNSVETAEPMRVVPIEEVAGREVPQDQLNQDVMEQLDRNYEAIKEATNAAQDAKTMLEGMGGKR